VLRGVIVDERSGDPVQSDHSAYFWVEAMHHDGRRFSFRPYLDSSFCIQGIPPGVYSLYAVGEGRGRGYVENLRVGVNQRIEGIRVPLPRSGILALRMRGFRNAGGSYIFMRVEGRHLYDYKRFMIARTGLFQWDFPLEEGSWRLIIEGDEVGRIDRGFVIEDRKSTEVSLDGREILAR